MGERTLFCSLWCCQCLRASLSHSNHSIIHLINQCVPTIGILIDLVNVELNSFIEGL